MIITAIIYLYLFLYIKSVCLGIPAKVIKIKGDFAVVDYGGVQKEVNIAFVDVKEEDYVIIHAGFAIQKLEKEEAEKTLELWREIFARTDSDI